MSERCCIECDHADAHTDHDASRDLDNGGSGCNYAFGPHCIIESHYVECARDTCRCVSGFTQQSDPDRGGTFVTETSRCPLCHHDNPHNLFYSLGGYAGYKCEEKGSGMECGCKRDAMAGANARQPEIDALRHRMAELERDHEETSSLYESVLTNRVAAIREHEDQDLRIRELLGADRCAASPVRGGLAGGACGLRERAVVHGLEPHQHPFTPEPLLDAVRRVVSERVTDAACDTVGRNLAQRASVWLRSNPQPPRELTDAFIAAIKAARGSEAK